MIKPPPAVKKFLSLTGLLLGDLAALALSFGLAAPMVRLLLGRSVSLPGDAWQAAVRLGALASVWIAAIAALRLYTRRFSYRDEALRLFKAATTATAVSLAAAFLNPGFEPFPKSVLVVAWLLSFFFLPAGRKIVKRVLARAGLWRKRVLLIGSPAGADAVVRAIRANRILGYELIGVLTDEPAAPGAFGGLPVLGRIADLDIWKARRAFDHIVVHLPTMPGDQLTELLRLWENASEVVHYIPRTGGLIVAGVEAEDIGGVLSLTVRRNLAKPWNILIKTVFEYVLAITMGIALAPVLLLAAAAVKIDSRGPVFFRQIRYGRKGRRIRLFKLRTMHVDAEDRLAGLLAADPRARAEWQEYRKLKGRDPRITRVGRFLRRTSLDELPQLLNVLRGEMSLVGPRPYLIEELRELEAARSILFQVRPGLTGLWQVSGRSLVPFRERLSLDEHYVRNWSFWLDIIILIKTPPVALFGKGAF
jgi:undecaprenyl-phosphate galactose phosphotransferase